jgi:hypothetical protein
MIDESAAVVPLWMLLSAAFGFMIGDALGNNYRHRKCLEQANEDLRDELERARADEEPLHMELRHQRGVIHDTHKQLVALVQAYNRAFPEYAAAVSKGPEKPLS